MQPDPKQFYDGAMTAKLGHDYEYARWKASPLVAAQRVMMEQFMALHAVPALSHAQRILEVGPGSGTWTKVLLTENPGANFTLLDISKTMLAQARAALPDKVTFVESDFVAYDPQTSFDGFFSSRAVEYMPDKTAVALKLAQLLAPGAKGVIITKTPKRLFDRLRGRTKTAFHSGQIAPRALVKALAGAGLRVTGVYAATATVPLIRSSVLNRFAYQVLSRVPLAGPLALFTESYGVVFEKP